jgi:hypothetical protein
MLSFVGVSINRICSMTIEPNVIIFDRHRDERTGNPMVLAVVVTAEVVTGALSVIGKPCGIESAIERNSEMQNSYSSDGDRPAVIEDLMGKLLMPQFMSRQQQSNTKS